MEAVDKYAPAILTPRKGSPAPAECAPELALTFRKKKENSLSPSGNWTSILGRLARSLDTIPTDLSQLNGGTSVKWNILEHFGSLRDTACSKSRVTFSATHCIIYCLCYTSITYPSSGAGPWPPHSWGFYTNASESVGLLWKSDQLVAETSTWQRTTLTRDWHPCPRRYSNRQSQQERDLRPTPQTERPLGLAHWHY